MFVAVQLQHVLPLVHAAGTIHPNDMLDVVRSLDPPLGMGHAATNPDALRFVLDLHIPLFRGRCPFYRTGAQLLTETRRMKAFQVKA